MDQAAFDRFVRLVGTSGSRRAAIAALLGAGVAGAAGEVEAGPRRDKTRKGRRVAAQAADCASLGHGADVSGCNYAGEDHSGENLSSSRMVGTTFRNGTLVRIDLSSSNLRSAIFREANLCGADLRSCGLGGVNFRDANLARANLKSSGGCGSAVFTGATFCGTVMCNGTVRNDACPGGPPANSCCSTADCPAGQRCQSGICVLAQCAERCPGECLTCFNLVDGSTVCGDSGGTDRCQTLGCAASADCTDPAKPYCVASLTNRATNETTPANCVAGFPRGLLVDQRVCLIRHAATNR